MKANARVPLVAPNGPASFTLSRSQSDPGGVTAVFQRGFPETRGYFESGGGGLPLGRSCLPEA
jgi:hypothetical protein